MFLTKKFLSRRTVLRGAGAAIALPLLDAMIPASTAFAKTAAATRQRLGFVYFPHGADMAVWTPKETGRGFTYTKPLKPLESVRDYVTVVSGLRNKGGESSLPHNIIEETWLNCLHPQDWNAKTGAGITADQMAARVIGKATPLPSLEICGEAGGFSSLSYRRPFQQLPMEINPRKVFFEMFGEGDTSAQRTQILQQTGSLLDYTQEATARLNRRLGASDRAVVNDYLDSVRAVELRVKKLEAKSASLTSLPDAPLGAPDNFTELLDVQFEMMALAWQTDQTRVVTFKLAKEATMRTYPQAGVSEAFHPLSHHGGDPVKLAKLVLIERYHTQRMAKFAERLKGIKDGDGNLLDHSLVLYGSNMSNSDLHNNNPLPCALIGKAWGKVKGGQHLHYPPNSRHSNLLVTVLQRVGVPVEKIGDSNGTFAGI